MIKKFHIRDFMWITIPIIGLIAFMAVYMARVEKSEADDIEDVNVVVDAFQEAYSNKRLADLTALFYSHAVVAWDGTDGAEQRVFSVSEWLQNTQEYVFDENDYLSDVLSNREIHVFRNIAYVVCDYSYTSDTKRGEGVDIFTMLKQRGRWKIVSLLWTGDEVAR